MSKKQVIVGCVLSVFFWFVWASALYSGEADSPLSFVIVGPGDKLPKVTMPVFIIQSNGSLRHIEGGEVTDEDLKFFLKRTKVVNGKEVCLIRLRSPDEEKVSIESLGKALQRIRNSSDFKIPTKVYVLLRELKS
jgi:hypothetical protein